MQVLAYHLCDVEHRPERIRVLHTERTITELRTDFGNWANTSIPQHCIDLVQNLTSLSSTNHTTQGLQPSPEQQQELTDCFKTVSEHLGSLTSIVLSGAQKFIDRNG